MVFLFHFGNIFAEAFEVELRGLWWCNDFTDVLTVLLQIWFEVMICWYLGLGIFRFSLWENCPLFLYWTNLSALNALVKCCNLFFETLHTCAFVCCVHPIFVKKNCVFGHCLKIHVYFELCTSHHLVNVSFGTSSLYEVEHSAMSTLLYII